MKKLAATLITLTAIGVAVKVRRKIKRTHLLIKRNSIQKGFTFNQEGLFFD